MGAGSGEALRQQLHGAIHAILPVYWEDDALSAIWPLVEAALAAARVATATEIAAKIADERMNISYGDIRQDEWLAGKATGFDEAIALIGGSVPAPQQAYCKPCDRWHVPGKHDPVPAPKGDQ